MSTFFEEFIHLPAVGNPKCLGVRVLTESQLEPGRALDSYGRRQYVLQEDTLLTRGSGRQSVARKGMTVMTMVHKL